MKDSQIPTEEWRITCEWISRMNDIIHSYFNSALCRRYPDLQIINDHSFDLENGSKINIFIGVTDEDIFSHEANLELFGHSGLVALPSYIYEEMYKNPAMMSNFELALGDLLDDLTKQSRRWIGDCGIVQELKIYMHMHVYDEEEAI